MVLTSLVIICIAFDLVIGCHRYPIRTSDSRIDQQTESIIKVEAEVERKMDELRRYQPYLTPTVSSKDKHDPMNDTHYMQAVRQKVDEVERIARENGLIS
jgi:Tfp pilus assembly protein PilP